MKKHLFALSAAIYSVMSMTPCVFAEGSEEGGALPPFCADLALWTAVTFVLVLIVLWKFAWGPIIEGLDKREQYVLDQRSDAEKANADAKALLEDYKSQLANAKADIQQMKAEAQASAEKSAALLMSKAMASVEAEKKAATQEINNAKIQAQKELASQSAALAVELAGKILKKELNPQAHQKLIDQAVAKFGK